MVEILITDGVMGLIHVADETSSKALGLLVPIPTLPLEVMRIRSEGEPPTAIV